MNAPDNKKVMEVEHLRCCYGSEVILDDVSFSVAQKEILFVAGRSGCGKTTLLRHLVGLMSPARGRIAYFGRDFTRASSASQREFTRYFGVLFQNNALWTDLSLGENVALPLLLHTNLSGPIRAEIVALKLAQVGLAGYEDRFPEELSGGMQKRAALARALALDPAVLFFDEPTAGLDPITAHQINQLILQMRDTIGATVFVVSHSLAGIFTVADRLILLHPESKGIIAEGAPLELARTSRDRRVTEFLNQSVPKLE